MAKAKGTKEAPVEEFSVDVEQSDTYYDGTETVGGKTPAAGTWKSYGNGNPDWNDPDD
jgi:hypothetical protein